MSAEAGSRRVLLKISGEALSGEGGSGVDPDSLATLADALAARPSGVEVAVVVGGGNFVRGEPLARAGLDRVTADTMGMLGTVMNGLALAAALRDRGTDARVLSAVEASRLVEAFSALRARRHLEAGRLIILVGGTGNPFFTTDTCAALRAAEIGASWVLKGTKVDGVYSDDPKTCPDATRYDRLTFAEALAKRLEVMDSAAFQLCRDEGLRIRVFDMFAPGNLGRVLEGDDLGTVVVPSGEDERE